MYTKLKSPHMDVGLLQEGHVNIVTCKMGKRILNGGICQAATFGWNRKKMFYHVPIEIHSMIHQSMEVQKKNGWERTTNCMSTMHYS